jgi:hypothetical protein
MRFIDNKVKKLQQGGPVGEPMPAEAAPMPAEAPQQGGDPMQMLVEAAMAAVQNQDPNMAMEVCMMLLELVGVAPSQAPVGAPAEGQPVFRKGGKMKRKGARKC